MTTNSQCFGFSFAWGITDQNAPAAERLTLAAIEDTFRLVCLSEVEQDARSPEAIQKEVFTCRVTNPALSRMSVNHSVRGV